MSGACLSMFSCSPGVKRRPKATEINLAANSSALAPPGVSPGARCQRPHHRQRRGDRLRLIRSEVGMIREFLTDNFPPSNAGLGTDSIQAAGSRVEQLKIMGTANMGQIPRFLNG